MQRWEKIEMLCKKTKDSFTYKLIAWGLIIVSFLLYAMLPFNLCLSVSHCMRAGIVSTMLVVSEIAFWLGSLMLGKRVVTAVLNKLNIFKK